MKGDPVSRGSRTRILSESDQTELEFQSNTLANLSVELGVVDLGFQIPNWSPAQQGHP